MPSFEGTPKHLRDYLSDANRQFVIPGYQRPYSWKPSDVRQLLADIVQGTKRLNRTKSVTARREEQSRFLGCVIEWQREAAQGKDFVVPGRRIVDRVVELIDGQQRVTTITLILTEYYYLLSNACANLDQTTNEERWLSSFVLEKSRTSILRMIANRVAAQPEVPGSRIFLPKIIRGGRDKWSSLEAEYQSAVSRYLLEVLTAFSRAGLGSIPERIYCQDGDLRRVVEQIRVSLEDQHDSPTNPLVANFTVEELLSDENYLFEPTPDIEHYLNISAGARARVEPVLWSLATLKGLLDYCVFTAISSPDEDTALDIFQSLNSTGLQLTAVQILKPHLFRTYGANGIDWEREALERSAYDDVNEWTSRSVKRTKQFFLKFSASVSGRSCGTELGSQRAWLLEEYHRYVGPPPFDVQQANAGQFVYLMRDLMEYLRDFADRARETLFASDDGTFRNLVLVHRGTGQPYPFTNEAAFSFMFLHDANHDLAHTLLWVFYSRFQRAGSEQEIRAAARAFFEMCQACAAFFALWRSSLGTQPDQAYDELLGDLRPATRSEQSASLIKREMRRKLMSRIRARTRERQQPWIELLRANTTYRSGMYKILKFHLLVASHRIIPAEEDGLGQYASIGPEFISAQKWTDTTYETLEHVAPQSLLRQSPENWQATWRWPDALRTAPTVVNSIGNLTLLSSPLNSAVPESAEEKCLTYVGLITNDNTTLSVRAAEIMGQAANQAHLVSVARKLSSWLDSEVTGGSAWDEAFVRRRAENIMGLSRRQLLSWLRSP